MNSGASRKVVAHRALSSFLSVLAVAGWGILVYSSLSSATLERDLRAQVANLWKDRAEIVVERDQLRSALAAMKATAQVAPVREETKFSIQEPASLKTHEPPLSTNPNAETLERLASETGSVSSPMEVTASVRAAQLALTQLGYGFLKDDGVLGPNTRRAIELFERAKGLAVSGTLGAKTVLALKQAVKAAGN
jgi:Putative peptidoglycan binding domain